jgi:hypothetical protein
VLGAFAIGLQLLLSAWMIAQSAAAAGEASLAQADLAVICTHDPASASDDSGAPPAPHSHDQCASCACPQWAKVLAPPPTPPLFAVLAPRSQMLRIYAGHVATETRSPSPYASRAPPVSA